MDAERHPPADPWALPLLAAILVAALVLQRIALEIGSSYLSVVGPIGWAIAALGMLQGTLALHRRRTLIFVAFTAWIVIGAAIRAAAPDYYGADPSWMSLSQFVVLTGFGALVLARPLDEARFFRMVNGVLLAIAIAGVAQFIVQFAGLSLFSFGAFVPARWLLEGPYANAIPIGDGGYFKSNGLFLVEPSVFSQFMALAIIVEMLMFRRLLHLACFAAGLVTSLSGTGWLMIFAFVATAAFSLGRRGVLLSAVTLLVAMLGLGALAVAFPAGFDLFIGRAGEIHAIGSSGHQRFITPWWLAHFVLSRTPWAALYGIGAGVSEHLGMQPPWDYNLNPPVKLSLEYGIPCFVLYVWFLVTGRKTSTQRALVFPILVLLLLTGGYQQFPPVLFPAMLLIATADLIPAERRLGARPPWAASGALRASDARA